MCVCVHVSATCLVHVDPVCTFGFVVNQIIVYFLNYMLYLYFVEKADA